MSGYLLPSRAVHPTVEEDDDDAEIVAILAHPCHTGSDVSTVRGEVVPWEEKRSDGEHRDRGELLQFR